MNKCINYIKILTLFVAIVFVSSCDQDVTGIGDTIMPSLDYIDGQADTAQLHTKSILVDPTTLVANTNLCYLGSYIDADQGISTTCDYLTKFYVSESFGIPNEKQIRDANGGELKVNDILLTVYISSFMGDSITPMALTYHELDPNKPLREDAAHTTNINPKDYLPAQETLTGTVNYTMHDIMQANTSSYYRSITDTLPESFGNRILQKYFENPQNFKNPISFSENVCPGMYIQHSSGIGAMSEIYTTALHMSFKYMDGDTIATGVQRIAATDEVIQTPRVINIGMESLLADTACTHLRAPVGVFTEVEIPTENVFDKTQGALLNNARVTFAQDTTSIKDQYIQAPPTVLLIPKSKVQEFFHTSQLPDGKTSYLANYDKDKKTYSFANIAGLITWMHDNQATLQANYGDDWNKAVLMPVKTATGGSDNTSITAVHNYYNTSDVRLKLNPTLYFIYSKYAR